MCRRFANGMRAWQAQVERATSIPRQLGRVERQRLATPVTHHQKLESHICNRDTFVLRVVVAAGRFLTSPYLKG